MQANVLFGTSALHGVSAPSALLRSLMSGSAGEACYQPGLSCCCAFNALSNSSVWRCRDSMLSPMIVMLLRLLTSAEIQRRTDFFAPFVMVSHRFLQTLSQFPLEKGGMLKSLLTMLVTGARAVFTMVRSKAIPASRCGAQVPGRFYGRHEGPEQK